MPLTFVFEGSSPERIRKAFRAAKRKAQATWLVVNESFCLRVGEAHIQFPGTLAQEFGLRMKQIANNTIPIFPQPETVKIETGPVSTQPVSFIPQRRGRKPKPAPPKEELFELLKVHSCSEVGEYYGVSGATVKRWLKRIPEAKELQRTYVCKGCGVSFTGPILVPPKEYRVHCLTCPLLKRVSRPEAPKRVAEKINEDKILISSLRERISVFDREIARLEEEKAKATEQLNHQIRIIKAQREEFAKKILDIISEPLS